MRRLVFDSEAIQKLRQQLTEWNSSRPPSKVVVVSAFLTHALLRADTLRHGKARPAVIANLINIRERTVPPIPSNAFGTWLGGSFQLPAAALAAKSYNATAQAVRDCARALSDKGLGRELLFDSFFEANNKAVTGKWKIIWVTDISKFGQYDVDFGFGKPEWVSIAAMPLKDHVLLLNNRSNDGIQAFVCLEESDLHHFLRTSNFFSNSKL